MRVMVVGRSGPQHVEAWIERAIARAGHSTTLVNQHRTFFTLGSRATGAWLGLRRAAFRPDLIVLGKAIGIPPKLLSGWTERMPTVMWYRDLRVPPDEAILERAREVETLFLTAGGQVEDFRAAGVRRVLYLPDGVDPAVDRPGRIVPELECDVAFLGTYDAYRANLLGRIAKRFRLLTFGRRWKRWADQVSWAGRAIHGSEFGDVCVSARIVLGIEQGFQMKAHIPSYTSNRMFRVVAAGGFFLGYGSQGARALLRDGEHCAYYDDEDHALERIEYYLTHDAERERIRTAGRAFILGHHTLDHRVPNLLTRSAWMNPLSSAAA